MSGKAAYFNSKIMHSSPGRIPICSKPMFRDFCHHAKSPLTVEEMMGTFRFWIPIRQLRMSLDNSYEPASKRLVSNH